MKHFLSLFGTLALILVAVPAMALQCTNKPADLIIKARASQTIESNKLDCLLGSEAAIHLSGKLTSSLVRADGFITVRFFNQHDKPLWHSRQGPWFGAFSGLAFEESFAVPPGAFRVHVVAQVVSTSSDASGEWRIASPTVSPGVVVVGEPVNSTVITTAQPARWRFSTVPPLAQGLFQMELRNLAGEIIHTRTLQKSDKYTEINFGPLPVGYYQAQARFTPEHVHPASWASALVVLPNDTSPNEPRFGMDGALSWYRGGKPETAAQAARMMRQAGIGAVRDRMNWSQIQPSRHRQEWKRFEEVARATTQTGMEIVQVFHDSPSWTRPGGSSETNHQAPLDDTAIFEFGQAYAKRLGKTVRSIEYWNEQNSGFFNGYPFQYASGLKAFSEGIKSIDPGIRVLIGAAAGQPGLFFEETYFNGVANFFDTRNLHYYGEIDELDKFLDLHVTPMERNAGMTGRPGWITETGYSLHRDRHGNWEAAERKQAEYLVKAYVGGFAAGYERIFFFFWGEIVEGNFHTWGIVRDDFSPRPAYLALALLTRHLAGAHVAASERHGRGRTVYFRKSDDEELVAVTWGGGASINRLGSKVETRDIFGQQLDNTSAEQSGSMPLLLSQINKLPEQAKSVNLSKQMLRGSHPLRLSASVRINEKNLTYLSGDKVAASVSDGDTIVVTARAYLTNPTTERLTVDCIPGPGLALLSPSQLSVEQPRSNGEPVTCRFRANLMATGKSHATIRARKGNFSDTIRIALIPNAAAVTANTTTRPLMPQSACPRWTPSHSSNLTLAIKPVHNTPQACQVSIISYINQNGNSWVFPAILLRPNELVDSVGLRLRVGKIPGLAFPPTPLRLQLMENSGEIWIVDLKSEDGGKVYYGLFNLSKPAPWARNKNGRLDIADVQRILVGWGGHSGIAGQQYGFTLETIDTLKGSLNSE